MDKRLFVNGELRSHDNSANFVKKHLSRELMHWKRSFPDKSRTILRFHFFESLHIPHAHTVQQPISLRRRTFARLLYLQMFFDG